VRISELSQRTGVPVATVKYYLREGLLPSGERTGVNQARYGEEHVTRLRLVRALVEVGGVPIAGVKGVLAAIEGPPRPLHDVLGPTQDAITPRPQHPAGPEWDAARAEVAGLVQSLDWQVRPDAPALDQLTGVLLAIRAVSGGDNPDATSCFGMQARLAEELAAVEVGSLAGADPAEAVRGLVVGTVLGGRAFEALRRLAHEDASARTFGGSPSKSPAPGAHRTSQSK
jgi:DNA-binding transcriptional MerR regulator